MAAFLERKECINPHTKELIMKTLSKKLLDKEIDIELFNQTIRSVADLDVPESKPITDFGFLDGLHTSIER
jgi:hypothetical protein